MARVLWRVPCQGHRVNGQPCRSWSVRGGWCCWRHGGATQRVRAAADYRLQWAGTLNKSYPDWRENIEQWRRLLTLSRDWPGRTRRHG